MMMIFKIIHTFYEHYYSITFFFSSSNLLIILRYLIKLINYIEDKEV